MTKRLSSYLALASSTALAQGFLLLISPIVTRLYGPEDVGGFGVLLGIGALIGAVGTGRLEHAVPVAKSAVEAIQIALLGMLLILSVSALSIVLLSLVPLPAVVTESVRSNVSLLVIPAISFSLAFFQLVSALLLRQRAYRSVGLNKIFQGVVTGLTQLLLGWGALGASGLLWAQVLGYFAGGGNGIRRLIARGCLVVRRHGLQLRATFLRYRRFPLVLAPAALFNLAAQHFPVLALGYVYGLYEAGLYALVMRVCGAPLGLLGQTVSQVYASEFRVYLDSNKGGFARHGGLARKYVTMLLRLLGIGVVVVGLLVLVMNFWGTWLFGSNWANIGMVSLLVSVMLVIDFATTPLSLTLSYLGYGRTQLIWDVGRLAAIVCVFVAVPLFSLRFGQLLVLFAGVWSLSLMVHTGLTYRACRNEGGTSGGRFGRQ